MDLLQILGKEVGTVSQFSPRDIEYVCSLLKEDKRDGGVYIRQSDKDADDKNGESRDTQLALQAFAEAVLGTGRVRLYDEGAGLSGQKGYDERPKLDEMYRDGKQGKLCATFVSREDRLFRDKHGNKSGTFTEMAEFRKMIVVVPAVGKNTELRVYRLWVDEDLKAFKRKMEEAYAYIGHVQYMNAMQEQKALKGYYIGGVLLPGYIVPITHDPIERRTLQPILYEPWAAIMRRLCKRLKELDFDQLALAHEIDALPFLFPFPSPEEEEKFHFPMHLRKVAGGYKPARLATIKAWFTNPGLAGIQIIKPKCEECKRLSRFRGSEDVHLKRDCPDCQALITHVSFTKTPIISLEEFKELYRDVTTANPAQPHHRKGREEPAYTALLHHHPGFTCQGATRMGISLLETSKKLAYRWRAKTGDSYTEVDIANLQCNALDSLLVSRIKAIAEADKHIAEKFESELLALQQQEAELRVGIEDNLKKTEVALANAQRNLLAIQETLGDTKEEQATLYAAIKKVSELAQEKQKLIASQKKKQTFKDKKEIQEFYITLANFTEEWPQLPLRKQKKFFRLMAPCIEIELLSPHWIKLTIYWRSSILPRPDVALMWRATKTRTEDFTEEEKKIIAELYPTCEQIDLLTRLPYHTWHTICRIAREDLKIFWQVRGRYRRQNIPKHVCLADITCFPSQTHQEVLKMIDWGRTYSNKKDAPLYAFWSPLDLAQAGEIEEFIQRWAQVHNAHEEGKDHPAGCLSAPDFRT